MKNVRMPLTAVALLSIVSGALGFKSAHFNQGTVFCTSTPTSVNTGEACTGQSVLTRASYFPTGGSYTNPCGTGHSAFANNGSSGHCSNVSSLTTFDSSGE